jgi:cytochrome c peroxidase
MNIDLKLQRRIINSLLGPLLVRLAWHSSGTYNKSTRSHGSNGSTMRFGPELSDPANKGLDLAQKFLEPIKQKYPEISYADLWILAAYVAIEEMGGPHIDFTAGRVDKTQSKTLYIIL